MGWRLRRHLVRVHVWCCATQLQTPVPCERMHLSADGPVLFPSPPASCVPPNPCVMCSCVQRADRASIHPEPAGRPEQRLPAQRSSCQDVGRRPSPIQAGMQWEELGGKGNWWGRGRGRRRTWRRGKRASMHRMQHGCTACQTQPDPSSSCELRCCQTRPSPTPVHTLQMVLRTYQAPHNAA